MKLCLATINDHDVILEFSDGLVTIDGQLQPIKNVTEEEVLAFDQGLRAIPVSSDPGYEALLCAKRSEFIVDLLGRAVGEECVDLLTRLLEHLHLQVLMYLEEDCDCENHHA